MFKISDYFDFYIENPFKTFNKIKKFFIKPKFNIVYNCWYYSKYNPKILSLYITDVIWKDKYNTPRFEINPKLDIILFRRWHFRLEFGFDNGGCYDMTYWETALNWIYYNKTLQESVDEASGWVDSENKPIKYKIFKYQNFYNKLHENFNQ